MFTDRQTVSPGGSLRRSSWRDPTLESERFCRGRGYGVRAPDFGVR